ncbi:MAG: hypothetical protein QF441_11955 [Bacteriovoracaceae bacterium]|nr:hypothetical protein [Halobacteriovoraceae bacterium]MDP7321319.1 hypothetical protein [Bacteriovoracaceae bacterium]
MAKYLFLFNFLSISFLAHSTTFVPLTIKQQIKTSDGIVKGEVVALSYEQDNQQEIVTKATILADKWVGLNNEDNLVDVYYPGGKVGNHVLRIPGAPKLNIGEKVVLMLRNQSEKIWVNNLGLGKFSLKKLGDNYILVNQVFPANPKVGQMKLEKFLNLVEWVKKTKFKERFKDKYEISREKAVSNNMRNEGVSRSIASTEANKKPKPFSNYWLVLILGALGIIVRVVNNKKST